MHAPTYPVLYNIPLQQGIYIHVVPDSPQWLAIQSNSHSPFFPSTHPSIHPLSTHARTTDSPSNMSSSSNSSRCSGSHRDSNVSSVPPHSSRSGRSTGSPAASKGGQPSSSTTDRRSSSSSETSRSSGGKSRAANSPRRSSDGPSGSASGSGRRSTTTAAATATASASREPPAPGPGPSLDPSPHPSPANRRRTSPPPPTTHEQEKEQKQDLDQAEAEAEAEVFQDERTELARPLFQNPVNSPANLQRVRALLSIYRGIAASAPTLVDRATVVVRQAEAETELEMGTFRDRVMRRVGSQAAAGESVTGGGGEGRGGSGSLNRDSNSNSNSTPHNPRGREDILTEAREELALAHKFLAEMGAAVMVLERALENGHRPVQFRMVITRYLKRVSPFNNPLVLEKMSLNP